MVRDVRNHTFNHSVDSFSPDHAAEDPPTLCASRPNPSDDRPRPLDFLLRPAGSSPGDGASSGGTFGGESSVLPESQPPGTGPRYIPCWLVTYLFLRHDLIHNLLVLLRMVLCRGLAPRLGAARLVVAKVHRVVLRVVNLRWEASRRVVVAGRQGDVDLIVGKFHAAVCRHQVGFSHAHRKDCCP